MKTRNIPLWESVLIAVQSILAHKLRAFLTLLGIIIGVASVMAVGASIEGLETYVKEAVATELGSNSFTLSKFPRRENLTEEDWERMARRNRDVRVEDIAFLRERCQDCEEIAGEISSRQTSRYGAEEIYDTRINGITPNIIYLRNLGLSEGRFFSDQEAWRSRFVCVIGWDLKERFFPNVGIQDRYVKVGNYSLKVIGVLEKVGSLFGQSQDNVLYVPITTYRKMFGTRRGVVIRGRASSRESFQSALDQVRVAIRVRHHLKPNEDDDFGLTSAEEINLQVDQFTGAIAMVVTPITLISLIVGGVVVMNIMLVSVTERTFEIGLRKALGARRREILFQFLIESTLLASLGGAVGLGLALLVAWIVESNTPIPMTITFPYIALSLGVSAGIGIFFGIYPAFTASKLDPIVALGAER